MLNGDARALLSSAVRFKLDEGVRDRIIAETRGNPLALLELPRGLTATELAGGFGLLGAQALTGRIEESFVRRLERARRRRTAAAAGRGGGAGRRSAAAVARGRTARHRADRRGGRGGGRVAGDRRAGDVPAPVGSLGGVWVGGGGGAPRGPLGVGGGDRSGGRSGPSRVASGRGPAGPDEQVAAELERSAGRAQARGGLAAAAAFLQRAVALTQDRARRADRALAAAQASFLAGEFDAALGLVATAEAGPLDEFQRARVDLLRGHVAFASGLAGDAPTLLLKAAKRFEPLDLNARARHLPDRLGRGARRSQAEGLTSLMEICDAVQALPRPRMLHVRFDLLLDGFVLLLTRGTAPRLPTFKRAAKALADMPRGGRSALGLDRDGRPRRPCGTIEGIARARRTGGPAPPRRRGAGGAADPPLQLRLSQPLDSATSRVPPR